MKRVGFALVFIVSACAALDQSNGAMRSTSAPFAAIAESLSLRQRLGAGAPQTASSVYVETSAVHHTRVLFSTIATRSEDGVWSVSTVGEETSGLLKINPRPIPERTKQLSAEEGRVLDRLVASPGVFHENPRSVEFEGVGIPEMTMEIVTPNGRTVIRWRGELKGKAGDVANLVLGPRIAAP